MFMTFLKQARRPVISIAQAEVRNIVKQVFGDSHLMGIGGRKLESRDDSGHADSQVQAHAKEGLLRHLIKAVSRNTTQKATS